MDDPVEVRRMLIDLREYIIIQAASWRGTLYGSEQMQRVALEIVDDFATIPQRMIDDILARIG